MSYSSSYNFSMSCDELISESLEILNAVAKGQTPKAPDLNKGRRRLNILLKNIMGRNNPLMPGLKIWLRKSTTLTLTATAQYQLKPSTIAFASGGTYEPLPGDTITGATGAATATIIDVEVDTGTWDGGDAAGTITLINQSGAFEAENLDIGSNTDVATITGDSSQEGGGKDIIIPLNIQSIIRRNSNDIDSPPMSRMTQNEYNSISNKSAVGTPSKYFYERKLDAGYLTLNRIPSDITDTLIINYLSEIQDLDDGANDLYIPGEYYRPIMWMLADDLEPEYPVSEKILKKIEAKVRESNGFAQTFEPDESDAYFQPGLDE